MQVAPPLKITYISGILGYNVSRYALNLPCSNSVCYNFKDNVWGATI